VREDKSLLDFCMDLSEKDGSFQQVGPEYYNDFLIDDKWMEFIIRAIISNTAKDIKKIAFSKDKQDEDLYELFFRAMRLIAVGILSIREDGTIVFTKPLGEPQTEEERMKIEARINNTRPLIEKILRLSVINKQATEL